MRHEVEPGFGERVEAVVAQIPPGRVMTYGQLAALCGNARAARIVGGIAHFGDPQLPWQRVVNKQGGLAAGYPGGRAAHAEHLRAEGVMVSSDYYVDVDTLLWWPEESDIEENNVTHPIPYTLIAIVGETASGKSELAMQIAEQHGGELICADATTVYKGFDIGTAKPSLEDQKRVPHHLLDVTDAETGFNAPLFQQASQVKIADIITRGKLPVLVGGTGLYVDSVLYNYSFLDDASPDERARLDAMGLDELLDLAQDRDLPFETIDVRNKRRVVRLIENNGAQPTRQRLRPGTLIVGLAPPREALNSRIDARVDAMLQAGLEEEVRHLAERYGWEAEPMKAIGYREWREYFDGTQNLGKTRERIVAGTRRLAKKQRTWFRRNPDIHWFATAKEALAFLENTPIESSNNGQTTTKRTVP